MSPSRDPWLDRTPQAIVQGYRFGTALTDRSGSDIVSLRLLGHRTVLLRGSEAAAFFYGSPALVRQGAAPRRMRRTLLGEDGVQTLDGPRHRLRKAMFLSLTEPSRVEELVGGFVDLWRDRLDTWQRADRVVLLDEVGRLLTEAAMSWVGAPVDEAAAHPLHQDLRRLIDSGARLGPAHWQGRSARRRLEQQFATLVVDVRRGSTRPADPTAMHEVSWFREPQGDFLHEHTAAVELLNVVRPLVAVARYITFAALALHEFPDRAPSSQDAAEIDRFVDEVRRYYPFFPVAVARAVRETEWRGQHITTGSRVLLDLYATDHHDADWKDPDSFDPDRFIDGPADPYALVPQGGGDVAETHRCPGEGATRALTAAAVELLVGEMTYAVPPQDLTVALKRMPTQPASGFVIREIRRVSPHD